MKENELRDLYTEAVKIVRAERRERNVVLFNSPKLQAKLAEMDRLEQILTKLKDALKEHLEPDYEQPKLLDAPRHAKYN